MKPQPEQLNQAEALPSRDSGQIPVFDSSKEWNGMYDTVEEYRAAEAAYTLDLNTINLEAPPSHLPATTEGTTAVWQSEEVTNPPSIEVVTDDAPAPADSEIIDVEAKVIKVEDLEDNANLAELIDSHDEIEVEGERLYLTPKLKTLAKGVLSSLEHLLTSDEAELPEEVDWRPYIMSEPDYDESYDYITLHRLLNAQYQKQRRRRIPGANLADIVAADIMTAAPPPPITPEGPVPTVDDIPEGNAKTSQNDDDILKIEMNQPTEEVPKIEYESKEAPALTYDNEVSAEEQDAPKQITQQ
jgi:hypothetical protein